MSGSGEATNQLTNAEVARLRALTRDRRARHEAGRFVVEGIKLVTEVLGSRLRVHQVCVEADRPLPEQLESAMATAAVDVRTVARRGIERIAATRTPQPVVAEVEMPDTSWESLSAPSGAGSERSMLVALDLNDPGNLGTLVRSAVAAGFDSVVCLGDTVDPYSPKVIRAAAGALFRVPVVIERDADVGLTRIGDAGTIRYGTRMSDAVPCDRADLSGPIALVLGSEAHGMGDAHDGRIDQWLTVPMPGRTESLNVAMAGTILTYEVARQRRAARN